MQPEFTTHGERLLGRSLLKEKRAGVEHYVTGQHEVVIEHEEDTGAYLAGYGFVDQMGRAVLMLLSYIDGGWDLDGAACAGIMTPAHPFPIPDCFVPSDEMLKRLSDKLEEVKSDV